jgi:hypothetical protein
MIALPTALARAIAEQHQHRTPQEAERAMAEDAAQQTAKDAVLAVSYPRGQAMVAWCDAHPDQVPADAKSHVERLRAAMLARQYIAPLIAWVACWVPETAWLGCQPQSDSIDAAMAPAAGLRAGSLVGSGRPRAVRRGLSNAENLGVTTPPALSEV